MGDTLSAVKFVLDGQNCTFSAQKLWNFFSRTKALEHLQREIEYIRRKNAWNDFEFTRHDIPQLLRMPGAEMKIYGVEKWVILLVLFRSRIVSWQAWKEHRQILLPGRPLSHTRSHLFTTAELADIQSAADDIRGLVREDNHEDYLARKHEFKQFPNDLRLEEGVDFEVGEEIGAGGNGIVYAAWVFIGSKKIPAAYKKTRWGVLDDRFRELHFMLMVQHENVMRLWGWAQASRGRIGLLMPRRDFNLGDALCDPLGHISALYLQQSPMYIRIAIAISRGLAELHRKGPDKPIILHRDFKPQNVLISGCFETIEISDFGSSKAEKLQSTARTPYVGTRVYEAPELEEKNTTYTTACDIWSCGLVLAQIRYRMELKQQLGVDQMIQKLMPNKVGSPLTWPKIQKANLRKAAGRVQRVAEMCLRLEPQKRATAADCVKALGGMEGVI